MLDHRLGKRYLDGGARIPEFDRDISIAAAPIKLIMVVVVCCVVCFI